MSSGFWNSGLRFLRGAWKQLSVLIVSLGVLLWIYTYPETVVLLRIEDATTFYWLAILFAAAVFALIQIRTSLWNWLREGFPTDRRGLFLLGLTILIFLIFTYTHSDERFRQLSDEQNHLQVAQSMYHFQRVKRCNEGDFFNEELSCISFQSEVRPKTFPLLVTFTYSIFGENLHLPFLLNLILYLLTGLALFRVVREFGLDFRGQLAALVIWCLWPLNIWEARAAGYEMSYAFFVSFTFLLALAALRMKFPTRSARNWFGVLLGCVAALACQTRTETIASIPAILLPAVPFVFAEWSSGCLSLATFFIGITPEVILRAGWRGYRAQAPIGVDPFSLDNFGSNLVNNLPVMFGFNPKWPSISLFMYAALFGVLILLFGLLIGLRKKIRFEVDPLLYFSLALWLALVTFVVFAFFAGNFTVSAQMRLMICLLPAITIYAAYFVNFVLRRSSLKVLSLVFAFVAIGIGVGEAAFLQGNRLLRTIHLPIEDRMIEAHFSDFDPRSVFFYSRPPQFLLFGHSAFTYMRLLNSNDPWMDEIKRKSGDHLYYVRGLDCSVRKKLYFTEMDDTTRCEQIESKFKLEEVYRARVMDHHDFQIFRILGRK